MVSTKKKRSIWKKAHIFKLIQKYKEKECLWNINHGDYKMREKREAATAEICKELDITREQFSKKIHNLRNQFNFESKKEHNSHLDTDDPDRKAYSTKWEYYNQLKFLKNIITPRPGYATTNLSFKISTDYNDDDENVIEHETISMSDKSFMEEVEVTVLAAPKDDKTTMISDHKMTTIEQSIETTSIEANDHEKQSQIKNIFDRPEQHHIDHNFIDEQFIEFAQEPLEKKKCNDICSDSMAVENTSRNFERNEYDVFGEFVATEIKSLSKPLLRKRLKRKIMEAILTVTNEDDE